jgi:Fic family protein
MDIGGLVPADRNVEGIVEMMLDATQNYAAALDNERLLGWHTTLFPTGRSGLSKITVGAWRTVDAGATQVVFGPIGHEHVIFEAPDAAMLEREMNALLDWFEGSRDVDPVVKAGLAHLWFVTVHPFDDGNGRIARAIADLALARSEGSTQRFYSMSSQIRVERAAYYDQLEGAQKGSLDVTPWLTWFLDCLDRAIDGAETVLASVLHKARFWDANRDTPMNERQRKIVNLLLGDFEGKLTSSKWAKIAKCFQDTALRDVDALVARGVLAKEDAGGRSTSYTLVRR